MQALILQARRAAAPLGCLRSVGSSAARQQGGASADELARDTAVLNSELFEFFGLDTAQRPSTDALSQHIATSAAQRPQAAPHAGGAGEARADSSSSGAAPRLTHVDVGGKAAMVDVGGKAPTARSATAAVRVLLGPVAFELVAANRASKGDVLTVSQLAGIMGAKQTASLIPLCHPLALSYVDVALTLDPAAHAVDIAATAATTGPTGVEMEAMTAAAVAALTVYDMCKAASKGIEVTQLRLLRKSGGKSGEWVRPASGK